MATEFMSSETKVNLLRAFAGESQARNRYTFAASEAKKQDLYVVSAVFSFTAEQEKEHAQVFYELLSEAAGENIHIDGAYPIDIDNSVAKLLRMAQHNELEEYNDVYKSFAETASREGFGHIANTFESIAKIEKTHAERFAAFAELLENGKLFVSDVDCEWMCLNCGHIYEGKNPPELCPVCSHNRGWFIRFALAPYEPCNILK